MQEFDENISLLYKNNKSQKLFKNFKAFFIFIFTFIKCVSITFSFLCFLNHLVY